jgi:hypothetical protein
VRYRTSLTDRAREIAVLEVAAAERSDFEWYAHERVRRRAGLTGDEIRAVARNAAVIPTLSQEERCVRAVAQRLLTLGDLDDAAYGEASAVLGTVRLHEVVVLVGYYTLLALSLRVWRTPLPAGETSPFGDTGRRQARRRHDAVGHPQSRADPSDGEVPAMPRELRVPEGESRGHREDHLGQQLLQRPRGHEGRYEELVPAQLPLPRDGAQSNRHFWLHRTPPIDR